MATSALIGTYKFTILKCHTNGWIYERERGYATHHVRGPNEPPKWDCSQTLNSTYSVRFVMMGMNKASATATDIAHNNSILSQAVLDTQKATK